MSHCLMHRIEFSTSDDPRPDSTAAPSGLRAVRQAFQRASSPEIKSYNSISDNGFRGPQGKSTAYKPLPITPRNTAATRRFGFRSGFLGEPCDAKVRRPNMRKIIPPKAALSYK